MSWRAVVTQISSQTHDWGLVKISEWSGKAFSSNRAETTKILPNFARLGPPPPRGTFLTQRNLPAKFWRDRLQQFLRNRYGRKKSETILQNHLDAMTDIDIHMIHVNGVAKLLCALNVQKASWPNKQLHYHCTSPPSSRRETTHQQKLQTSHWPHYVVKSWGT